LNSHTCRPILYKFSAERLLKQLCDIRELRRPSRAVP